MKLESLYIDAFRGATRPFELSFNKGQQKKRITIIYGTNGSGKTTIVDAVDVLANDGNNSLKDKSLGNVGLGPLVSIGRQRKDTIVRIQTNSGKWAATLSGKSIAVAPDTGCPRIRVLRRRDLSGLLDEAGTDRYKRLRKFIDTEAIEVCEENLRDAGNRAKRDFSDATDRFDQSERDLKAEWESMGCPEVDFKVWLRSNLDANDTTEKESWRDRYGRVSALAGTLSGLIDGLQTAEGRVAKATTNLTSALEDEKNSRSALGDTELADLRAILSETALFLKTHPVGDSCPVCAQPVSRGNLEKRIQESLQRLSHLDAAARAFQQADQTLKSQQAVAKADLEKLTAGLRAFSTAFHAEVRTIFPALNDALASQIDKIAADASTPEQAKATADSLYPHLPEIAQNAGNQRDLIQKELSQRESVSRRVSEASSLKKKARSLEELSRRLAAAQKIVEEERKTYVEGILHSIAGDASRIYDEIHPGEGLGKVKLVLNPSRRGSLDCTAAIPGLKDDDNPAAYYSEAHLDTLGFAVFMAEALRESPQDTILVLDDIVSSVDEEHLQRVVTVLYEESKKFAHVILTTHYKPWREKFRMGLLRDNDAELLELYPNPPGGGIAIGSLRRPERERLAELIVAADQDYQSITAKAGVLLEQVLHFVTHTYACSLPCGQHDKGWDIGQYFSAISSKLTKALKTHRFDAAGAATGAPLEVGPLVTAVKDLCGLRNVLGCHYNKLAEQLPDADAISFGQAVLNLADALVDTDGELPTRAEGGQCWTTSSKTLRLYPFSLRDL